jgi:hypothetical protein
MDSVGEVTGSSSSGAGRVFQLQGAFQGKASKWSEEVAKARVEGRFSEAEREDPKWALRHVSCQDIPLSIYAAIFEEGPKSNIQGRRAPAPIRIVLDEMKGARAMRLGEQGVEIVVSIKLLQDGEYKMDIKGLNHQAFPHFVTTADFMAVLSDRGMHYPSKCLWKEHC